MNEPSSAFPLFPDLDSEPTSSPPDGPARETAWLDGVLEWLTGEADSGAKPSAFLPSSVPLGFLAKTSPVFCRSVAAGCAPPSQFCENVTGNRTTEESAVALDALTDNDFARLIEAEISSVSWPTWRNWGMGPPTAFLTLSGSEFRSDAGVSSLSDILETGDVPQKYFSSPKACRGILRRAEKRGRTLPQSLRLALEQVADLENCSETEPE